MSAQDLTSYTRSGLAGGIMIDNHHGAQYRISRTAAAGARRDQAIRAAGPQARSRRVWGLRRSRQTDQPASHSASQPASQPTTASHSAAAAH